MEIQLDIFMTPAVAAVSLFVGELFRRHIKFFTRFCIPSPVIGGVLFALISLICHVTNVATFTFDPHIKNVCMMLFYTTVGLCCNIRVIRQGGKPLVILILLVALLVVLQNALAMGISVTLGHSYQFGLVAGSIPMVGGHGTSAAFGPVLEKLGVEDATTFCTAAATFGLVAGSLIGGPIAERLIEKNKLTANHKEDTKVDKSIVIERAEDGERQSTTLFSHTLYLIVCIVGFGILFSHLLELTGITFPTYMGCLIVGALARNFAVLTKGKFYQVPMEHVNTIGECSLSLFLGIAMCSLELWELFDLALPLCLMLLAETILMFLVAYHLSFRMLGGDYDAAVMTAGVCGFGMGATPNAMANVQSVCDKYHPSIKAYLLIPMVGAMFSDMINSLILTALINL